MVQLWFRTLIGAVLALLAVPALAANGQKVALIVANAQYSGTSSLTNPPNDAALIAKSAKAAGFTSVTLINDASLQNFQRALRDFREKANGADVAMVYYAGHGIEGSGKNWLLPVDAQLQSELDLRYEAIELDLVLESISGADLRMVVLDACRNNPFGRSWKSGTRAVTRGLGQADVDDVLVIYAAAPGQTASDGTGGNSPFATSLAKRLTQPGLPVQMLGGSVRDDVLKATDGMQRPFVSASITGTPVYLVQGSASPATAPASVTPSIDEATLDALAWQGALGAGSADAFREYKAQFPSGRFVKLADQNITKLSAAPAPEVRREAPRIASQPVQSGQLAQEPAYRPISALAAPALIFPNSSRARLMPAMLIDLSPVQLRLARNEIFARHGFIFNTPELAAYFGRFDWYQPMTRDVKLNAIEQANVAMLQTAERASARPGPRARRN